MTGVKVRSTSRTFSMASKLGQKPEPMPARKAAP